MSTKKERYPQVKMLEEFGTAPGQGGKKETLIDVEAEKRKEAAKPLPGQTSFEETKKQKEPWEMTRGEYIGSVCFWLELLSSRYILPSKRARGRLCLTQ